MAQCCLQLLSIASIGEPNRCVWQVPPVSPGVAGDVTHAGGHQGVHLFADVVIENRLSATATDLQGRTAR